MSMRVDISSHRLSTGEQRATLPTLEQSPRADEKTQDVISKADSPLPERRTSLKLGGARIVDAQILEKVTPNSRDKEELTSIENKTQKMVETAVIAEANRRSISPPKTRAAKEETHSAPPSPTLRPMNGGVLVTSAELHLRQGIKASSSLTSQQVSQERKASKEKNTSWTSRFSLSPKLGSKSNSTQKSAPATSNFSKSEQDFVNQYFDLTVKANKLNEQHMSLHGRTDLTDDEIKQKDSLNDQLNANNAEIEKLNQQLQSLPFEQQVNRLKSILAEIEKISPSIKALEKKDRPISQLGFTQVEQYGETLVKIRNILVSNPKIAHAESSTFLDNNRDKTAKEFNQNLEDLDHGIITDPSITSKMIDQMQKKIDFNQSKIEKLIDKNQINSEKKILDKLKDQLRAVKEKHAQISNGIVNLKILNRTDEKTLAKGEAWIKDNLSLIDEINKNANELNKAKTTLNTKEIELQNFKKLQQDRDDYQNYMIKEIEKAKQENRTPVIDREKAKFNDQSAKIEGLSNTISRLNKEITELTKEQTILQAKMDSLTLPKESVANFIKLAKNNPDVALGILTNANANISYLQCKLNTLNTELDNFQTELNTLQVRKLELTQKIAEMGNQASILTNEKNGEQTQFITKGQDTLQGRLDELLSNEQKIKNKIQELSTVKDKADQQIKLEQQLLTTLLQPSETKESQKTQKNLAVSLYQSSRKALTEALKHEFADPAVKQNTLETAMQALRNSYQIASLFITPQDEKAHAKLQKDFDELQSRISS